MFFLARWIMTPPKYEGSNFSPPCLNNNSLTIGPLFKYVNLFIITYYYAHFVSNLCVSYHKLNSYVHPRGYSRLF